MKIDRNKKTACPMPRQNTGNRHSQRINLTETAAAVMAEIISKNKIKSNFLFFSFSTGYANFASKLCSYQGAGTRDIIAYRRSSLVYDDIRLPIHFNRNGHKTRCITAGAAPGPARPRGGPDRNF
jgi:hypothetical protein